MEFNRTVSRGNKQQYQMIQKPVQAIFRYQAPLQLLIVEHQEILFKLWKITQDYVIFFWNSRNMQQKIQLFLTPFFSMYLE